MVPDLIHNGPLGPALPTTRDRGLGTTGTLGRETIKAHFVSSTLEPNIPTSTCIKRCMSLLVLFIDG